MSKQLLRSGTSVGANVREAVQGQSKADFVNKMRISLKEISETEYWLELLYKTEYLTKEQYKSIGTDCSEIAKIITSIVKNSK
jgi:four helix bundle protein